MIDHLVNIAAMSLTALGAHVAMGEGMVLAPLHNAMERLHLPVWVRKPLTLCPRCMVSVWGTAALLVLGWRPSAPHDLAMWAVYALCAVGLQEAIDK